MDTYVIIDKNIRHGKPVIQGTRITVEEVLGALVGGMTFEEIEQEYGVNKEGIRAAVRYAAGWFQGEEVQSFSEVQASRT
ncbi:MAG: hypothetical protein G01um101470_21 [Parcubacteria group bacterium Gr01-1014_70]|nr:MAG: hypothetical protein G01um101470_21 [Parcubacteria group bacterium Gr01-1014_70]